MSNDSEIKLHITGDANLLSIALKKAREDTEKTAGAMATAMKKVRTSFGDTLTKINEFGAMAAIAAAGGLAAIVKKSIDTADELSKMSQKVGVSTENLSTLAYAAELADVNLEQLQTGLVKLAKNAEDAANGTGDAQGAFKALDIEIANSDGTLKTSDTLLKQIASKFADLEDGTDKTALAVKLFGKSGAELIPLLNAGGKGISDLQARAQQLGLELSTEAGLAAETFNDQLTALKNAGLGLARAIAVNMLPDMLEFVKSVRQANEDSGILMATWVALGGLGKVLYTKTRQQEINQIKEQIEGIKKATGSARPGSGMAEYGEKEIAKLTARLKELQAAEEAEASAAEAERERKEKEQKDRDDARKKEAKDLRDRIRNEQEKTAANNKAKAEADQLLKQGESAIQSLERQIAATGNLTKEEAMRWETSQGQYRNLSEAHKQRLIELSAEIDTIEANSQREKDAAETLEQARADAVDRANEKMREIGSILESVKTDQERYNATVARLKELLDEGSITFDVYQRAIAKAKEALDDIGNKGKDTLDKLNQVIQGWGKDSAAAIVEFCTTGKSSFSDMVQSMINDILKMLVYQNLTGPLASGISSVLSGGTFASGWTSFSGRASGGSVSSGKMYEVNERGIPELLSIGNRQFLMMADKSGYVDALTSGSPGSVIHQNDGVSGSGSVTVINNNISANDAQSFDDMCKRNRLSITTLVNDALKNNEGLRNTIKRTR